MPSPIMKMKRQILFLAACFVFLAALAQAGKSGYLPPGQVNLTLVLAPAPTVDSTTTKADLAELMRLQSERTPAQEAAAEVDRHATPYRFADVLGSGFNEDALPLVTALFKKLKHDENFIVGQAKNHWNRPRPFTVSSDIHPSLPKPGNASYPSGHSTFGHLTAIILAAMVPEKAEALFERGDTFARQRLIGGVHYPSDVAAGKIAAAVIASALFQNKEFQADFAKAKAQLRKALDLAGQGVQ